jgi:lipoate---protein ligase
MTDAARAAGADVDRAACRSGRVTAAEEQAWNRRALRSTVHAPAWRVWRYRAAAVVVGCAQRHWAAAPPAAPAARGLDVVARDSGGGAVLVGPWMLGLSVVLPAAHPRAAGAVLASYRWLGEAIASALHGFGIAATASPPQARSETPADALAARDWACFGALSPWEVVVHGRKIAGLAQRRRREGVLFAAGVLTQAPPWGWLCETLGQTSSHVQRLALASTSCAQEGVHADDTRLSQELELSLAHALEHALDPAAAG